MAHTKLANKLIAALLTLSIVAGQGSITALASHSEAQAQAVEITAFAPLPEEVQAQTVPLGTAAESLNLPASLVATLGTDEPATDAAATPAPTADVPVTWAATPAFDGETAGLYTFAPQLPAGYTPAQGIATPEIAVTVQAAVPKIRGFAPYSTATDLKTTIEAYTGGARANVNTPLIASVSTDKKTVTVTGNITNAKAKLELNIDTKITVVWQATLEAASSFGPAAVSLINLSGGIISAFQGIYINSANVTITITGGTITSKSKTISGGSGTAGATLNMTGGTLKSTAGDVIYLWDTNATATITGGTVETESTDVNHCAIVIVKATSTLTVGGSAIVQNTGAGSGISAYCNITIEGNATVTANRAAVYLGGSGTSSQVTINGGTVCSLSSSASAISSYANVVITGGRVTSNADSPYWPIILYGTSTTATISGGTVFGCGKELNQFVHNGSNPTAFTGVTGTGLLVRWNKASNITSYLPDSTADITLSEAASGGTAKWAWTAEGSGIAYTKGGDTRFIPVHGVTVVAGLKTATVGGTQSGNVIAGTAGKASFVLTTINIENGKTIALNTGSYTGISLTPVATNNNGATLQINTAATLPNGSYPLTVTVDGTKSSPFNLVVSSVPVTFTATEVGGAAGSANSLGIELVFSVPVKGLTLGNITLAGGPGVAEKGTLYCDGVSSVLSTEGTTRYLELVSVATQGNITVEIANFGIFTVPAPQTTAVHKGGAKSSITFTVSQDLDSAVPAATASITIAYGAIAVPPLAFTTSASFNIPSAVKDIAIANINVAPGASGGTAPYSFTATALPAGISISTAGVISGTPTAAEAAGTATITVTDSASTPATRSITIAYGAISAQEMVHPLLSGVSGTWQNGGSTGHIIPVTCTNPQVRRI